MNITKLIKVLSFMTVAIILILYNSILYNNSKKTLFDKKSSSEKYYADSNVINEKFDYYNSIHIKKDKLIYYGIKHDPSSMSFIGNLYCYDLENKHNSIIPLQLNKEYQMQNFHLDSKDNIYLLVSNGDNQNWEIISYDSKGNLLNNFRISKLMEENRMAELWSWFVDDENIWIIDQDNNIMQLPLCKDGLSIQYEFGKQIISLCIIEDRSLVFLAFNDDDSQYVLYKIDSNAKKIEEVYHNKDILKSNTKIYSGQDNTIIIDGNIGLYIWDHNGCNLLFDWLDMGLNNSNFTDIYQNSSDEFWVANIVENANKRNNKLELTRIFSSEKDNDKREIIELATVFLNNELKNQIYEFNNNNKSYKIHVNEYGGEGGWQEGSKRLIREVNEGKNIDIVEMDMEKLITLSGCNLLVDLYPYLKESNVNNIIPSILNTYEINGQLPGIMYKFEIDTVIGRKSVFDKLESVSIEELMRIVKAYPNYNVFSTKNREEYLYNCLLLSLGKYNNLNNEYLRKSLILTYKDLNDEKMTNNESSNYLMKNIYLDQEFDSWIEIYKKIMNEDISLIGYPGEEGGSAFNVPNLFGIISSSSKKEGAWSFIRTYLTDEYQNNISDLFPINETAFNNILIRKTNEQYDLNSEGELVENRRLVAYYLNGERIEVMVGARTMAEIDRIKNIVKSTNSVSYINENLMNIINKNAKFYYDGEKNIDEVVDGIQNNIPNNWNP